MGRRRSLRRMFHKVWYNHEKTPLVRFHVVQALTVWKLKKKDFAALILREIF